MTPSLGPTVGMLDDVKQMLLSLDGREIDLTNKTRYRVTQAELTRDLLRASDRLAAVAALVREEYWRVKGLSFPG